MSISDKLMLIANNVQKVFDGGKKAEYDNFWDAEQENGNRRQYSYGFYAWRAAAYNPKYPIIISGTSTATGVAAFSGLRATETKVDITIDCPSNNLFQSTLLTKINKLILTERTTFTGWFNGSSKLEEINVEGIIANTGFNVQYCPNLNTQSLKSILKALSSDGSGKAVTFHTSHRAIIESDNECIEYATAAKNASWTIAYN